MTYSKNLLFSQEEYEDRVERVREHMRERGVDVLLIDQTEFLAYLTGFSISENMYRACLLPLEDPPVMVLRAVDLGPFLEGSWIEESVAFADWEDPIAVVARTIRKRGWSTLRIGIDEDSYCMPLRRFKHLQSLLTGTQFVDFSGVMEIVRARKSPQEQVYLRRASIIADLALGEALAACGEGRSARDAAAAVHRAFIAHGADTSRAGIFTTGVGNDFLHGNLHNHPFHRGDILHMELLPFVNGYSARLMRPAIMGSADRQNAEIARQLIEAQDRQFEEMAPGRTAKEIDAIARDAIYAAGLRPDYLNITGYSLGYYPMSTPHTSDFSRVFLPTAEWVLKPDMVFHMYVSASGIAFSETILVTKSGIERLTRATRQLFEI